MGKFKRTGYYARSIQDWLYPLVPLIGQTSIGMEEQQHVPVAALAPQFICLARPGEAAITWA